MGSIRDRLLNLRAGKAASDISRNAGSERAYDAVDKLGDVDAGAGKLVGATGEMAQPPSGAPEVPALHRDLVTPGPRREFPDRSVPLLEYMGPEIDAHIRRYEPVLAQRILDLKSSRWVIGYGPKKSGDSTDLLSHIVNIDGGHRGDPLATARVLAHEISHAHPDGYQLKKVPLTNEKGEMRERDDWVDASVEEALVGEGDADIEVRDSRQRTLDNGGPDIGLAFDHPEANLAYELYRSGKLSRDDARVIIGSLYGEAPGFRGSIEEPVTYNDLYKKRYEELWDRYQRLYQFLRELE